MNTSTLLELALTVAKQAGEKIMTFYQNGDVQADIKADDSPVTNADFAANDFIVDQLQQATPQIPIISEESNFLPLAKRQKWSRYWLIDPIDGTGEFILRSGDFAVNIALVENGWPTMGVIHAPCHGITYYASSELGAFKESNGQVQAIKVAEYDGHRPIKVAVSRRQNVSVTEQYLSTQFEYEHVPLGSCSLKNCLIAEGVADCYLRIGPTGEWDTGASHCIVEQAGGRIIDSEFYELSYNKRESLLNPDFMTIGNKAIPWHEVVLKHQRS